MAKIFVRSLPAPGFQGVMRAGKLWPATGVEAEVLDQAADPPPPKEGEPHGPLRIGTDTLAKLKEDPRIAVSDNDPGAISEVARLREENKLLRDQLAQLNAAGVGVPPPPPTPVTDGDDKQPTSKKQK